MLNTDLRRKDRNTGIVYQIHKCTAANNNSAMRQNPLNVINYITNHD